MQREKHQTGRRGLNEIVALYVQAWRPRSERELACFQQLPTLRSAISQAAFAINSKGKRYSHQYRIPKEALNSARQALLARYRNIRAVKDFDELFQIVKKVSSQIFGLGELYTYDTSLRIGAKLKKLPTKVYLHAGTRSGARALGLNGKEEALRKSVFPVELQRLPAHEIEDVLCIFASQLKTRRKKLNVACLKWDGWCD